MSKTSYRRHKNLARYFSKLAHDDEDKFLIEWDKRVKSWLDEIHLRGERRCGAETRDERVFGLLERVSLLLRHCDKKVEALVGLSTREVLVHESCKVFSIAVAPDLYRIVGGRPYGRK